MKRHGVRDIIFVHGTFAGCDPLGLFIDAPRRDRSLFTRTLARLTRRFLPEGIEGLQTRIKQKIDNHTGDVGNFLPSYVETCARELGNGVCKTQAPFVWSSANLHRARLDATVKLAAHLAHSIAAHDIRPDERILLIGHSHAGQLFALLTHFLHGGALADALLKEVDAHTRDDFTANLQRLRGVWLDFVTYGTPVRYRWARYPKFRLLPVINHRANPRLNFKALYNVEDGDYVQQWGTEGTDTPRFKQEAEQRLSAILGEDGFNLAKALTNTARSLGGNPQPRKEHKYLDGGTVSANVLIDYQDQRPPGNTDVDYCIKALLGHGVYTTAAWMPFNTRLIADAFYP